MCNQLNVPQLLEEIVSSLNKTNDKRYWMVRTDDGANYSSFSDDCFVALNLSDISISHIQGLKRDYPEKKRCIPQIKEYLIQKHLEGRFRLSFDPQSSGYNSNMSRLAGQIYTMAFEISLDDIVLIPSHGAHEIKIGRIVDADLAIDERIVNRFSIARKVEWIKTINKRKLDPCLYKALGAHQAICDISDYSEYIERNYQSYFKIDEKMHYVLTVNKNNVGAANLSRYILGILETAQMISDEYSLGVNMDEFDFTINVNSPGKFSLISTVKGCVLAMTAATVIGGGTLHYDKLEMSTNGAFKALVEGINSFLDSREDRREKQALFDRYMQSLEVQSVEDWSSEVDDTVNLLIADTIDADEFPFGEIEHH